MPSSSMVIIIVKICFARILSSAIRHDHPAYFFSGRMEKKSPLLSDIVQ
jgi:hypothetical protein